MTAQTERRFEPWPWALAGLLLAMIAGSLAFYAVARAHPDPLVVDDAYGEGLRLNDELHALERGAARHLELFVEARPTAAGTALALALRGPDGRPARPDRVRVRRERPAQGGFDEDFALAPADGRWRGEIPLPLPGRWLLVARAELGDAAVERRVEVERAP